MKFTVSKAPFSAALARCAVISEVKSTLSILTHCLLTVTPGSVKIFATDLEVGYETAIEIRDPDFENCAFTGCFPAKKLSEVVKSIPSNDVHIEIDTAQQTVTVYGGTVTFKLAGLDADEYPELPSVIGKEMVISASSIHDALAPIIYCQAKDPAKSNLNGSLFKLEENDDGDVFIVTASTDGHRLCLNTLPVSVSEDDERIPPLEYTPELASGVIIPAKAVTEILHLGTEGPAVVTIAGNNLLISSGDERLTLRLIDLAFPDVNRVIPKNQHGRIIIKRQSLIDAVARVKVATDKDNMRGIDLEVAADRDAITLSGSIPARGIEAQDGVTAEISGEIEPMRISCEYLLQALANITTASVELLISDPVSPLLIIPSGTDFPQAVIMPMRGK